MSSLFIVLRGLLYRIIGFWINFIPSILWDIRLHARDFVFFLGNAVFPLRPVGKVVPEGKPGYGGVWPMFRAPGPTDSRSPCPGLNAMANHGIIPRDGKHITYERVSKAIQDTYNFSPSLADQTTAAAYTINNDRGWFDLHDLNAQNVVQHDASFFRPDIAFSPDQSKPDPYLVERFLKCSSDGKRLSVQDIAYYNGLRRTECKKNNGQYSLSQSFLHKFFGSGNAAFLIDIFHGSVADLRVWLTEERIPDGWESRCRYAFGHTIIAAQLTTLAIEFRTWEDGNLRPGHFLDDAEAAIKKGKQKFSEEVRFELTNVDSTGERSGE